MKIVSDSNIPDVEKAFATFGNVVLQEGRALTAADVADADVLLVRSVTRVDAKLLEGSPVAFVGSATSGYEHIDRQYLNGADIEFAYAPGSNARSVVEYVLAAIAQTGEHLEGLLGGTSMGIIGYGHVAKMLVALCDALRIRYCVYDPWLERVPNCGSLAQVLQSDVISLHSELTLQQPWPSRHLLDAGTIQDIRPGTLLINASRGSVIDNDALLERLKQKTDINVVLDVWEGEPAVNMQLLSRVTQGTPHIAGYSHDAKLAATYRLMAAAAEHFNLRKPSTPEPVAAPSRTIDIVSSASCAEALRSMISARYVIAEDDRRMREALRDLDAAQASKAFDQLRKTYPVRRELWGSTVRYDGSDETVLRAIRAVGCALTESQPA